MRLSRHAWTDSHPTTITTGVIAEQLFISPTTVETHVRKAMTRLGAKNRAHLIALALNSGEI